MVDDTVVLLVDAQPVFLRGMHGDPEPVLLRLERLLMFAEMTDLPVVATLEAPVAEKGDLPPRLARVAGRARRIAKKTFDALQEPRVRAALDRGHVVVAGAETEVCVLQTVLALRAAGYAVTLLEDCCFTSAHDPRPALERMAAAGAVRSTFKSFAYELLGTVDRSAWPEAWRQREHLFPPPEELPPLRRDYTAGELREQDLDPDPVVLFGRWFADAQKAGLYLPDAMALATAGPDARMVVLRGCDERGFVFFTSLESPKAKQLARDPRAALVFFWNGLERQVRVRGRVEAVSRAQAEAYFATRPRGSQVAAVVSTQSAPLGSRAELDERARAVEAAHEGREVPAPPSWGGYRVVPQEIEFWQGRANRLHDRFLYVRDGATWRRSRLAP